jgi:hypothetical protein
MGRTDPVAHDPSDRVRRGHLPALCAGRKMTFRMCPHHRLRAGRKVALVAVTGAEIHGICSLVPTGMHIVIPP